MSDEARDFLLRDFFLNLKHKAPMLLKISIMQPERNIPLGSAEVLAEIRHGEHTFPMTLPSEEIPKVLDNISKYIAAHILEKGYQIIEFHTVAQKHIISQIQINRDEVNIMTYDHLTKECYLMPYSFIYRFDADFLRGIFTLHRFLNNNSDATKTELLKWIFPKKVKKSLQLPEVTDKMIKYLAEKYNTTETTIIAYAVLTLMNDLKLLNTTYKLQHQILTELYSIREDTEEKTPFVK